jgi:hypothetical protein
VLFRSQPGFYLGVGMQKPPRPRITIAARIKSAP